MLMCVQTAEEQSKSCHHLPCALGCVAVEQIPNTRHLYQQLSEPNQHSTMSTPDGMLLILAS